jgi:hypothetical protein
MEGLRHTCDAADLLDYARSDRKEMSLLVNLDVLA